MRCGLRILTFDAFVTTDDVKTFRSIIDEDAEALVEIFRGYLHGIFRINHASIVPRPLALLPIAAYFAARKRAGHEWRMALLIPDRPAQQRQPALVAAH
jgi:hypothetical protein